MEGLLIPAFGYKSHVNIDRCHGLIRRFTVTDAARHDGGQLPKLLNEDAFDSPVWADIAYRSKANETAIEAAERRSMLHFRKPKGKSIPERHRLANRARLAIRSAVEHVFADQKTHTSLFVRTIGLARATVKIGMANLAHNFRRLVTIHARSVPAQCLHVSRQGIPEEGPDGVGEVIERKIEFVVGDGSVQDRP